MNLVLLIIYSLEFYIKIFKVNQGRKKGDEKAMPVRVDILS